MMKLEEPFATIMKTMPERMKYFTKEEGGLIRMTLYITQALRELGGKDGILVADSYEEIIKDNIKAGNLGKKEMKDFFHKAKKYDLMDIVDGNVVWFPSHNIS